MSYYASTRHPWACLIFLLPILAAYEIGVASLGGADPFTYRNGADAWLRIALEKYGVQWFLAAPFLVAGWFFLRSLWDWNNKPDGMIRTLFGMIVESAGFAFLLWLLSRNFQLALDQCGIQLNFPSPKAASVVTFIGAGIYEEVLFRLCLFSLLVFVLRLVFLPTPIAVLVGAFFAALAFAAAHHLGPYGEPMNSERFLFRFLAGIAFTALYVFRGFGIAVGAHAGYDVLVGVSMNPVSN